MKGVVKSLPTSLFLGILAASGIVLSLSRPAAAQNTLDPLPRDEFQGETTDPFSQRGSNQMTGLFELIHRANLGSVEGQNQFYQEQRQSIGDAAVNFRNLQREAFQQNAPQGNQLDFVRPVYLPPAPNN